MMDGFPALVAAAGVAPRNTLCFQNEIREYLRRPE